MAQTNDWTDFLERLNADKVRRGASSFTTMELEETNLSDMTTYSVVMIPRKPSMMPRTQQETPLEATFH